MFFVNGHAVLKTDWNGPKNFRAIGKGSVNQRTVTKSTPMVSPQSVQTAVDCFLDANQESAAVSRRPVQKVTNAN